MHIIITSSLDRSQRDKIYRAAPKVGLYFVRKVRINLSEGMGVDDAHRAARSLMVRVGFTFTYTIDTEPARLI